MSVRRTAVLLCECLCPIHETHRTWFSQRQSSLSVSDTPLRTRDITFVSPRQPVAERSRSQIQNLCSIVFILFSHQVVYGEILAQACKFLV